MAVLLTKISLEWLEEMNACNIEKCREYFKDHGEFELTAENILKAHRAGVLSSNWLARRILTDEDLREYQTEMEKQYAIFERHMAPFLARIVLIAKSKSVLQDRSKRE